VSGNIRYACTAKVGHFAEAFRQAGTQRHDST
jgi:hypothetical protein